MLASVWFGFNWGIEGGRSTQRALTHVTDEPARVIRDIFEPLNAFVTAVTAGSIRGLFTSINSTLVDALALNRMRR